MRVYFWKCKYLMGGDSYTMRGYMQTGVIIDSVEEAQQLEERIAMTVRKSCQDQYGRFPDVDSIELTSINKL